MKFRIVFFLIVIALIIGNCSQRKNETQISKELALRDSINRSIDAAIVLFDMAIVDVKSGKEYNYIVSKYQDRISLIHHRASAMTDSISYLFIAQGRTKLEYDKFMSKLEFARVKLKAEELRGLGVLIEIK